MNSVPPGTADPPTRAEPNNSMEDAEDLYFDTNPFSGYLDASDTEDWYRILDLIGDTENDQLKAQEYSIGLKRTSGANVKGILMEPNGLVMGEIYSEGAIEELAFIVPRDGDYFLLVMTDPRGSSSSYEVYQGGNMNVDNRPYDKNNVPPGIGFSDSVDVANYLDPSKDMVDYFHISVPSERSLEATIVFEGDLTFKLQVLNETYFMFAELGSGGSYIFTNDGGEPIEIILRVYVRLSTRGGYPTSKKPYNLEIVLWSHLTKPMVNPSDPWTMARTSEDQPLFPNINLTRHFMEPNGDDLEFELVDEPENLDIQFVYTTNLAREVVAVNVSVVPHHNWYGDEVLTFRCSDPDGNITDSITVNVTSVNDLPYMEKIGEAQYKGGVFNMFAYEDEIKIYKLTYDDEDDPISRIFFASNETFDFLEINPVNGTMTIEAVQEDVGDYMFDLQMSDTHDIVVIDIHLRIEAVNERPPTPQIKVTGVDPGSVLPGEEVHAEAVIGADPDGDVLTFTWEWGDGRTSQGRTSSHVYATGIYGNRTVRLTVSDGRLTSTATILLFLEKPEDLSKDDLVKSFPDISGDVVKFGESWRPNSADDEKKFKVEKLEKAGVDITSLVCRRRGNDLEVTLSVKDSIQIDGTFRYFIYVLEPGYSEGVMDLQNISEWAQVPDRHPFDGDIIAQRQYLGDPALHNMSTGTIIDQRSIVWLIPFTELVEGGLDLPIDPLNFSLFAVSEHAVPYRESMGMVERYEMSDTAGEGALVVGPIKPEGSSGGGGGSNLADISTSTKIGVVIALVVLLILIGLAAFYFARKQAKEKKKEEQEFIDHVRKMREEGKDLFDKEVENEGAKPASYQDLYGTAPPEGHDEKGSGVPVSSLPKAGLGKNTSEGAHIIEHTISSEGNEGNTSIGE
ncbi:MAG: PKD domain-containing protein [Candidatus Thermoplasmatota archaeon]|nr:PKD domain-containing protein [Candidatus Thermoplasmatota archaeon]